MLDHETYLALEAKPSDWTCVPGFRLETVMYDLTHNVFLGTARDLIGSAIRRLLDAGWFGSLDDAQANMFATCSEHGILGIPWSGLCLGFGYTNGLDRVQSFTNPMCF